MVSTLGRTFDAGETIIREGEVGDCMYVIQEGEAEVVQHEGGADVRLCLLRDGDFFGEMAIFEQQVRCATVRAVSAVRVVTVDRKMLLRRISSDPSLAFRMLEKMSARIRALNVPYAQLRSADRIEWESGAYPKV